jgi:hypothetical protein
MARKRMQNKKTNSAVLPVMRPDAAGIDIGATEIFVAVPSDRAAEHVRSFPTFTQDLYALADWLNNAGSRRWRWSQPGSIGFRCSRSWSPVVLRFTW